MTQKTQSLHFSNREIIKITLPVLLSLIMEQLIGITDTAYLGRVGEAELGASAIAGVFYLVIFMLGFGFSIGAQVIMARRNGEHRYKDIGPVFTQGNIFLFLMAAFFFLATSTFAPRLLGHIIESEKVYNASLSYLNWRIYGYFFAFTAAMFRAFYVATTNTRILISNSVVMVLTNVVLNYVLIFGKLGFPALGIAGAAMASSISEAVSLIFFIVYTKLKTDYKAYDLFRFNTIDLKLLRSILGVAVWIMLQQGLAYLSWFYFFVEIEHLGETPLAITNIVRSLATFLFMFLSAFASTASSLISNLIGLGKQHEVVPLSNRIVGLCFLFITPLVLLLALFPQQALAVYTNNPVHITQGVAVLWVMLSSFLLSTPGVIYEFSVSGTGDTRAAMLLALSSIVVYMIYIYVMVERLHADVIVAWTSDHVYYLVLMLSYVYLRTGRWQRLRV